MAGPYTAFTYGDPAGINNYASNPDISNVHSTQFYLGLQMGASYTPVPVAEVLAGGAVGVGYTETISVQGGVSPFTFAVSSGGLPTGLSLASSTGVISGVPLGVSTSTFTITVTDANGQTGSQVFQISIAPLVQVGGGNFGYVA